MVALLVLFAAGIMKRLAYLLSVTALVGACAAEDGSVEDGIDDAFTGDDSKSDAFGVEDWSPDGAAVLSFTSTATKAKLQAAGLTAKVAKSIVENRDGSFDDLRELDAVPFVGPTVFKRLLAYVAEKNLFKTAIRVPLLVQLPDGYNEALLTSFNDAARTAGVTGFAPYTYVQMDTKFDEKMAAYDRRLAELAEKTGTETGEMKMYASSLGEFSFNDATSACFVGNGAEVADIAANHSDGMMSDMYITWASRFGTQKWTDDWSDESEYNEPAWDNYDTDSNVVLILSSATDSGDEADTSFIGPCRE